ncbi:MAG: diguanylate cyclase [Ruminococcus sp.]|nr:diguanylate cyclase [Ruminococcus sp.]
MSAEKKRRFPLGAKLYLFIIITVFAATFGAAFLAYRINVSQIDNYFKNLAKHTARNFASFVDPDFLDELNTVASAEEYQALREQAEEDEDEAVIQEYLTEKGLWEQYDSTRSLLIKYLRNMSDIKYLYIVKWGDMNDTHDMYLVDDDENPIYETGYYEEREPEFEGVDPNNAIEPVINNGDWGWLCSAYAPVYNAEGKLVCHVGCDIEMEDIMSERGANLRYILFGAVGVTLVVLLAAMLYTRRFVITPLNRITDEMKRFTPSENKSYEDAGVIDLDIRTNDEIQDIYSVIQTMQRNIIDYLNDLSTMQKDKEKAENDARDKDKLIGQISKEAYKDSLTSVGNKAAYSRKVEELKKEIAGGDTQLAIVMVDINELKKINDNYGHNAGDLYIKGCCHIICEVFKHSPVYRIGGDEFVVIVRGDDYKDRLNHFEQLRKSFEDARSATDTDPWLRYSAASGMAEYASDDNTLELVFKRADKAMYADKLAFKQKNGNYR